MAPHPCVITNFKLNYQVHKTRYTLFFTEAFFISTGILFTPILYTIIKWQLIYLCHINHFDHHASYHTTALVWSVCGWERVTEDIPPTFNLTGYDRSKNSIDMIFIFYFLCHTKDWPIIIALEIMNNAQNNWILPHFCK